jgi:hypothetical protein
MEKRRGLYVLYSAHEIVAKLSVGSFRVLADVLVRRPNLRDNRRSVLGRTESEGSPK